MDETFGLDQPRFTGMLRAFLGSSTFSASTQRPGLREEQFKSRAARTSLHFVSDKNQRGVRGLLTSQDTNSLNWHYFEELLIGKEKHSDYRRIETLYRSFIRLTQQIAQDDHISSSELHSLAYSLYKICRDSQSSFAEKKHAISKFTTGLNDQIIQNAIKTATELDEWRNEKLSQIKQPTLSTQQDQNLIDKDDFKDIFNQHSFGSIGLDFKYDPSNFSDDESMISFDEDYGYYYDDSNHDEQHTNLGSKQSASVSQDTPAIVDISWLRNECSKFINSGAGEGMALDDLVSSLVSILSTSTKSESELQENLINVLGYSGFDFAMLLFSIRPKLLHFLASEIHVKPTASNIANPSSNFTITSKTETDRLKKNEKEKKRLLKLAHEAQAQLDASRNQLSNLQENQQQAAVFDPLAARRKRLQMLSEAQHPEKLRPASQVEEDYGKPKNVVPKGAYRTEDPLFESYFIPLPQPNPLSENETLKSIDDHFEPFAKLAFAGMTHLNRIQSRVYETAYKSNANMLICAPTGAGKTNIALMAILHEIGQHINPTDGVIRLDEFKIVYVAPMKALAAEMTENFGRRLLPLNVTVKELTGDMQLTKKEIQETQIIVTTPEKWDVITRKSNDNSLALQVRLLIIDEVHLLHEERGSVIESLVARTLRQVEQTQAMIRIVGLSATLPNYRDVAQFLRVNPEHGLFFFDGSYRPVPMSQEFIGVKGHGDMESRENMNEVCSRKMIASLKQEHQVMIFVHSRKDTVLTARKMSDIIDSKKLSALLRYKFRDEGYLYFCKQIEQSKNRELAQLFPLGIGFHNAGMLRSDRNLVEKAFHAGYIKVLVCTATLAWGVNLPAHTVIIKGTQVYSAEKGNFIDLGVLDIMQIFGRAGRPQFDTSGEAVLITTIDRLSYFLRVMAVSVPIESTFEQRLVDHLNAEIVLGTVSNIRDAVQWLSYTYLWIRMNKNPLAYGINNRQLQSDPSLSRQHIKLIKTAAKRLDSCQMIRFDESNGNFHSTELGRVASHFYIQNETIQLFNEFFNNALRKKSKKPKSSQIYLGERENEKISVTSREEFEEEQAIMNDGYVTLDPRNLVLNDADLIAIVSEASEFTNVKLRDEEVEELERLENTSCLLEVKPGETNQTKVNILIQSYISQIQLESFSLVSDMAYISQNTARIFRALFEITIKKNWPRVALQFLRFCKMVEHRLWINSHPLRQFNMLSPQIMMKLEEKRMTVDRLLDLTAEEVSNIVRGNIAIGRKVLSVARNFPKLNVTATIQPVTRTVIKIHLTLTSDFLWNDKIHGTVEPWWIWIEDVDQSFVYHNEYFLLHKKQKDEPQHMTLIVPIEDPPPSQYQIHIISDRWLGCETIETLPFDNLILPHEYPPHTALLPLQPLMLQALENPKFESIYNFTHFNAVQTQVFHTLYHTNSNVLLGAPTGSGKTIVAELAMLKLFRDHPDLKVVYIAPLKALVRERMKDWQKRLVGKLGKKLVELTGDYTPDIQSLMAADIVTTTPEKWDGISRNWQQRDYVQKVGLMIIDEIHLLGEERGPILEVIVSRMRYISSVVDVPIRLVGLSTALANALDLADWLGIDRFAGLYNFRPSVRPVRLEVHISGFRGKHYCPRMATMNKPAFSAIKSYSATQPALIFVSSRRQTRLTAIDLISCCATEDDPRIFLHMTEDELEQVLSKVKDANLRHTLSFGIGLHHAGLPEDDKALVEELFGANKIQVLVSTATLAWGVNLPAHLVVVKGTEFYDAKTKRYVDYPITDVLQMMGRAGRPQFDTEGFACVFVEESKKPFYSKFLYEPFPVESQLKSALHDHINAEIVSGTIKSKQDAVDYLTWTFFFRRLMKNPTYYQLENTQASTLNKYLSDLVDGIMSDLKMAKCIIIDDGDDFASLSASSSTIGSGGNAKIEPHTLGRVASFYYLHYTTMQVFRMKLNVNNSMQELLEILCETHEYSELPVRHNEDGLNAELAKQVNWPPSGSMDSPHVKANILLQAHMSQLQLPISDFISDTKQVLDQTVRVAQAMVDVCADGGWLQTSLSCISLLQMCIQGRWCTESSLAFLPGCSNPRVLSTLRHHGIDCLPQLLELLPNSRKMEDVCKSLLSHSIMSPATLKNFLKAAKILPVIQVSHKVQKLTLNDDGELECTIQVQMNRTSDEPPPGHGIYAPRYPKHKDEGWWLIVGDEKAGELLALRKLNNTRRRMTSQLTFLFHEERQLTLYLMSDCYIGLDQQYPLKIKV